MLPSGGVVPSMAWSRIGVGFEFSCLGFEILLRHGASDSLGSGSFLLCMHCLGP